MRRVALLPASLLLLTCLGVLSPAAYARPVPRIVGGADAGPEEAPWAAAVLLGGVPEGTSQVCGAAVISPWAVVTAAHCLDGAGSYDVIIGRKRLWSPGGERIPVAGARVNPSFRGNAPRNDVAVLLLSRPTRAAALPLAGGADEGLTAAGAPVLVYGWGAVDDRSGVASKDLKVGAMRAVSDAGCSRRWPGVSSASGQLCLAGPADGRPDACASDSGGPAVGGQGSGARLVGIVSFGPRRCGDPRRPSVFVRVANYARWIARQAGIASPPGPAPAPPGLSEVSLSFAQPSCPSTCRVNVRAAGEGAEGLERVHLRIRASGVDRVFSARRVGERRWQAKVGQLPSGRVRMVATGMDDTGRPVGSRAKVTLPAVG